MIFFASVQIWFSPDLLAERQTPVTSGFSRRDFLLVGATATCVGVFSLGFPLLPPPHARAASGGTGGVPATAAGWAAYARRVLEGTPPAASPVPSAELTSRLNDLRAQRGLFGTDISDIFAMPGPDDDQKVSEWAMVAIGAWYRKNDGTLWSTANFPGRLEPYTRNAYRSGGSAEDLETVRKFGVAYRAVELAATGFMANAVYSSDVIGTTEGGGEDFPVYPADVLYMLNGGGVPYSGHLAAGQQVRSLMQTEVVHTEYVNAVLTGVDRGGVYREGHDIGELLSKIDDGVSSISYQQYLRDVAREGDELVAAARYWLAKELASIAAIDPSRAEKTSALLVPASIAAQLQAVIDGDFPAPDPALDQGTLPLAFTRIIAAETAAATSTVRSGIAAIKAISDELTLRRTTPDVAGLERNVAIRNVFMTLTSYEWQGRSGPTFTADQIDQAVSGVTFTNNASLRSRIVERLNALNSLGILGSVAGIITFIRFGLEAANVAAAVKNGTVTDEQALALAARTCSTLATAGQFRRLWVEVIAPVAPSGSLRSMTQALHLDAFADNMFGAAGALWLRARGPGPSPTQAAALRDFGQFVREALEQDIRGVSDQLLDRIHNTSMSRVGAEQAALSSRRIAAEAQLISTEAEAATVRIPPARVSFALRAFSIGVAAFDLAGSIFIFAADIVGIVQSDDPPSASAVLYAVADGLGTVGAIISTTTLVFALSNPVLTAVGIGIAVVGAVFLLVAGGLSAASASAEREQVREDTTETLQYLEAGGYVKNWGAKIEFLSAYFDVFRDPADGLNRQTRWTPEKESIFDDESAAWAFYLNAWQSTVKTRLEATVRAGAFVSVPVDAQPRAWRS